VLLTITRDDGVIRLDGELDMASAEDLRTALRGCSQDGPLTVDASGLLFIDSVGLGVLIEAARPRRGRGKIVVREPTPAVRRVFEIALPDGVEGLEVQP
jgi:anti-anti-sigma factor